MDSDFSEPARTNPSPWPQDLASDDEGAWEDEPDTDLAYPHEKSLSTPSSQQIALVRRRKGGKTTFVALPNNTRRTPSLRAKETVNIASSSDKPVASGGIQLRGMLNDGAS